MLPRENRIVKESDLEKVKKEGIKVYNPFFFLLFVLRGDTKPSRFGFVVSSKISKKAVDRNRIKRFFRISIRNLLSNIKDGYDIIFIARKNILSLDRDLFLREVGEVLERKNILK